MATLDELVHTMNDAATKAARLYAFGEYLEGDFYARLAQRASDQIEASGPYARDVVSECGVS